LKYETSFFRELSIIPTILTLIIVTILYNESELIVGKIFLFKEIYVLDTSMILDKITIIFLVVVIIISSLVINYRLYYIEIDKNTNYFGILLYLFVLSMLVFIGTETIITAIIGWDGLGATSYLLIIYYGTNKSTTSGTITVIINRIADVSLIIAITIGDFLIIEQSTVEKNQDLYIIIIILCIIVKRAQYPIRVWLPSAMAAPTPVSSLVHSSTLVTAGLFILMRAKPCDHYAVRDTIMVIIGSLITTVSSYSAYSEYNIKKIVALSTLRQLGVMLTFIGFSQVEIAFCHLVIHAFFKRILFILRGVFLHENINTLDLRYSNSYNKFGYSIITATLAGHITLMALPITSSFFSKDLSIELSISNIYIKVSSLILGLSMLMTRVYSIKLITLINSKNKLKNKIVTLTSTNSNRHVVILTSLIITINVGTSYLYNVLRLFTTFNIFNTLKHTLVYLIIISVFTNLIFWNKLSKNYLELTKKLFYLNTMLTIIINLINKNKVLQIQIEKSLIRKITGISAINLINNTAKAKIKTYNLSNLIINMVIVLVVGFI